MNYPLLDLLRAPPEICKFPLFIDKLLRCLISLEDERRISAIANDLFDSLLRGLFLVQILS